MTPPPALADLAALGATDSDEVVGEVVDEGEYRARIAAQTNVEHFDQADTPDDYERQRAARAAAHLARSGEPDEDRDFSWVAGNAVLPPADQPMTVVEGNEYLAELQRAALARAREEGHAVTH